MNTKKKLEIFQSLNYNDRLNIVKKIIINLKNRGNIEAQIIFETLNTLDPVDDDLMASIYLDFEESIENIKKCRVDKELYKFSQSLKDAKILNKKEQEDKNQENPDDILNNL